MENTDDNADRFHITELLLVKVDWNRKFIGEINRHIGVDGSMFVTGKVFVQDGSIWSMATDQNELSENLDNICKLKLDCNLHANIGKIFRTAETPLFLN